MVEAHSSVSKGGFAGKIRLLEELAGNIGFALDHLEKSEKIDYPSCYDPQIVSMLRGQDATKR